jgi:CHAD domain-containing protein
MHFSFRSGETVREGVRRIGLEQIEALLNDLRGQPSAPRIHDARKRCKMLRALLRLARGGIDPAVRRAENARWREVAHALAGARDAAVRHSTFRKLISRPNSCRALAQLLERDAEAARSASLDAAALKRLAGRVNAGQRAWERLALEHHGWRLIGTGLRRSYAQARGAWRTVHGGASDETLHEWRKTTKTLWYHLQLLRKACPKKLDPLIDRLDELGELLGEDHDLATLHVYVREHDAASLDVLDVRIAHRRRKLQRKACTLARKCLHAGPSDFTKRLKSWWRHWRE